MSETRNNAKSLIKSLSYISDIYCYCENVELNSFLNDSMLADACLMKLIVLGEYVTRVSDDFNITSKKSPSSLLKVREGMNC
ncbi:MAG: hypothetical protein LUG12_03135 [Erysipelotrichaceae bacterium]|nr:hypothetical protein [Erysipelotrichaceae bacterium]